MTETASKIKNQFCDSAGQHYMNGRVALFVGEDATARKILQNLVPVILEAGLEPVIYLPKHIGPKEGTKRYELSQQFPLKELAFWERKVLNEVIEPYLDKQTIRPKNVEGLTPSQIAEKYDVKVCNVENINSQDFQKDLYDENFIGGISIRCYQIFRKPVIEMFNRQLPSPANDCKHESMPKGFLVNIHPGRLSENHADYEQRGILTPIRVMLESRIQNFWTLHEVEDMIDTGNIISRRATNINYQKPMINVYLDHVPVAVSQIYDFLYDYLSSGKVDSQKSTHSPRGEQYTFPDKETLVRFYTNDQGSGKIENSMLVDPEKMIEYYVDLYVNQKDFAGATLASGLRHEIGKAAAEFYAAEYENMVRWYHDNGVNLPEWHTRNLAYFKSIHENPSGLTPLITIQSTEKPEFVPQ